ncbi:2-oxo acid dehydrogenase subunit E2 [Acholeplasma hippikon]|uniref:Dihydrolipoamide acetyltransferase component of pyruvate dehydrogenase complex n=1 Tax=Acholeplasma hippikon TaxID=264636 RepID=A0A449BL95_9MOLU|nr:2-oxo acid dehydrogenase subunit E2 [Acholeplasma hippikon]VEU83117.1 branched-chain alpha-keto acid dehydrogenase subunit E2 [Acholeplasma hippikon]
MFEFKFADIGEGIHEGTILKWNFKVGDKVKEGDTLVIVETDKVNAELPSPVDGVIVALGKQEGEVIHVGENVVIIDDGKGAPAPAAPAPVAAAPAQEAPKAQAASADVYDFRFADIGEGIHEGTILKWNFKVGDSVKEGDTLVVVETDKVNAELPAPVSGTILKIGKNEGEVIHVGETVVLIGEKGATLAAAPAAPAEAPKASKGAGVVGEIEVSDEIIGGSHEEVVSTSTGKVLASPVARKLAADLGVEISTVKGTGEQGRVLKDDVQAAKAPVAQAAPAQAAQQPAAAPKAAAAAPAKPQGDVEVVKISRVRKAISNAMVRSVYTIPHTTLIDEINVNALVEFRSKAKGVAEAKGIKLTYMAFIAKAVVIALREFPTFNASFNHETDELYIKKYINLGMAVDTPDGLIVPNIKNAQNLSVFELASQVRKLADDTIARKISLDQQQHGTFTITNFGSAGIAFGTPVINYPELAILGVGKIEQKPVVENGEIKIASVLPLSLAVDHRIIDGADGGRFLSRIKELLTNPTLLLLS